MPRHRTTKSTALARRRQTRRGLRGGSLRNWLKSAQKWLKKTKAISKGANLLSDFGIAPEIMKGVSKHAGMEGYGRSAAYGAARRGRKRVVRRRRTGGALGGRRGGALRLAGMGNGRRGTRAIGY